MTAKRSERVAWAIMPPYGNVGALQVTERAGRHPLMPPLGTIDAPGSIVTLPGGVRARLPTTGSEIYRVNRYRPVIALSVTRTARDTSPRGRGKDAL